MGPARTTARLTLATAVLAVAILGLAAHVPTASGFHQGTTKPVDVTVSESVTLPVDHWIAYALTLGLAEGIDYNILVTNGTRVDVYFVPGDEVVNYADDSVPSFQFYREGTTTNTLLARGSFTSASGAISVIVDNVDIVPGDAEPTGPVTVSVTLTRTSNLIVGGLIFIACGVALLAIALVVFMILHRRRKAAAPAPPSPYAVPPHPYGPPAGDPPPPQPGRLPEVPPPPPPLSPGP
jgi:hypothetical protein